MKDFMKIVFESLPKNPNMGPKARGNGKMNSGKIKGDSILF